MLANQHQYNKTDGQESECVVRTAYCADPVRRASTQHTRTQHNYKHRSVYAASSRIHNACIILLMRWMSRPAHRTNITSLLLHNKGLQWLLLFTYWM